MPVWAKARMAAAPDTLRVVAFEDSTYHREAGTVYADRAFLTFMAGLHGEFGRLVVLGRLAPEPGRSHYPLPSEVEFVALPHYPDLLHPLPLASALVRAARRVWSVLGDADAAFILGPTPMSVLIAWIALLRRKRVVLGIRQNTTQYIRNRHPTRRLVHLGADLLELVWRTMTRWWCPVAVVGTEVAARYAVARSRHDLHVSLVHERDLASPEVAAARTYDGDIRVLSVGRLDVEKNPLMLADVLAALRAGGGRHRLVVCGDGPLHAELAERLQALGVAEHAELRGYVPVDALLELYRGAHLLLHVSWTEGLPQILYEAFAARLPVVATDVGGVRAAAGEAAVLIPPGDPAAAAAAVERVTGDPALRKTLIEAGAARAAEHTYEAEQRRLAAFIAGAPGGSPAA